MGNNGSTVWTGDTDPIGFPPLGAAHPAEQKLNRVAVLLNTWQTELARLDQISENYSSDLTVIRMVTLADHVRQMEEILYGS